MKRRPFPFNIYFPLLALALGLFAGCASDPTKATPEEEKEKMAKKEQSTIRLYLEGDSKANNMTSGAVLVTRNRYLYTVEREPFLNEGDLATASIVNDPNGDGFFIQLQFDEHSTLVLDMITAANKGKHIIVFAQFPQPGKHAKHKKKKNDTTDDSDVVEQMPGAEKPGDGPRESGWLAAVKIRARISNGVFRFTPDASRDEGVRIVRGLRNVLKKKKDNNTF